MTAFSCLGPLVRFSNDLAARDQECKVMKACLVACVGAWFLCLVEEQLCALITVRPVVERSSGTRVEPFAEAEDGHELVVVLLRRGEIRNANADVVDEAGSSQGVTRSHQPGDGS